MTQAAATPGAWPVAGAVTLPTPWYMSRYTASVRLRERAADVWMKARHDLLIRVAEGTVSQLNNMQDGEKEIGVSFTVGGIAHTTPTGRVFVCAGDEFQPAGGGGGIIRRVQSWESWSADSSIDMTAASGGDGGGDTPAWSMDSNRQAAQFQEVSPDVWEKRARHVFRRTRNESIRGISGPAIGTVRSDLRAMIAGELRVSPSGRLYVCTMDELRPIPPLDAVARTQVWEHIGAREAFTLDTA